MSERRSLRDLVVVQAERNPAGAAILAPGHRTLSYGVLNRQIEEVVRSLNSFGVGRNDRVAMVLPDGPEMAVAFVAISAGATCAPLNPAYRAAEFELHLASLHCRALLVPAGSTSPAVATAEGLGIAVIELMPVAGGEAGRFTLAIRSGSPTHAGLKPGFAQPDDTALALHTSGTVGPPKLVPLTHENICASAESIRIALELVEADRCLNVMPLFHIHGLSTIFASVAAGASVICIERFSTPQFFELMDRLRPTWYSAAPTIHRDILEHAKQHPELATSPSLRFIRSASAKMPRQLIAETERTFGVPFIEAYGMTEAAPQIASNRLRPGRRKPGSVGPAAGPDIAVMNEAGELVAPGTDGEVVIRGSNLMPAYEGNAEANRHAFVDGWFRTGDRGHLDEDGFLFITGRLREIINRGGEKVAPVQVDEVLQEHPAVAQAVTFPVPHATLGDNVAAAIVLTPGVQVDSPQHPHFRPREALIQDIRRFAATRLADFKVPQLIVIMREIPKGPTGKVHRMELAERLGLSAPGRQLNEFTEPRNRTEAGISEIWSAVLGIAPPGIHDNFFQSGGDSLTAAQVIARICREFTIELSVRVVFEMPTIAELGEAVTGAVTRHTEREANGIIVRRTGTEPGPLSSAQQRLWFLDQVEPGNPAYNMQVALRLTGRLHEEALERSLGEILRRHEALRTTFQSIGGKPVQVIQPAQALRLPLVDLTRLPESARSAEADGLARKETSLPFHLGHGPLFRVTLLRLDVEVHVLLLTMHHIVSDGWSSVVLRNELETLYAAYSTGNASPLPELPIQYADYASWQREVLQDSSMAKHLGYWKQQLEGMPAVLELPADRPRPPVQRHHGARFIVDLPAGLAEALKSLGSRRGATSFMTLLAGFQALLYRYTGQRDIAVGTPIANRSRLETEGLIGFLANTLVMRSDLSADPCFSDLLDRVRSTAIDAYAHQDLPFERLVEELRPDRDQGHNPLFQVMFAFQNLPSLVHADHPGLTITELEVARETAKFDLTLYVAESSQGLTLTWQYNTDLFDASRIHSLAGHFETLLEGIVVDPDSPISQLPVLTESERRRMLTTWNQTDLPYRHDLCFHHLFEEQARTTPDAPAVQCGDERLTYRELNERANQLAWRLRDLGVGPDVPVGIFLTRSEEMVSAVLAVMKSGGCYVALDPAYPGEHVSFTLEDAKVAVLITEQSLLPELEAVPAKVICIDSDAELPRAERERNPVSGATPGNLAYVIYTSGSTGKPKGVMITHANLGHYVHAMREATGIRADDCYLHTASFAFSSSVRQMAVPLASGARVAIASAETIGDPEHLFKLIDREGVTIVDLVPSYGRLCAQVLAAMGLEARAELSTNRVRLALSASEPLRSDAAAEWQRAFGPGARLINMFGQTETAGIVTVYPVPMQEDGPANVVPIGRPIANTRAYVLDAHGQPVPTGVWGELYIGGDGVGRGYLNEPGLTDEKFVPDPFSGVTGSRLYRTGDITRYRPDGNLEFLGRSDHQLKLRGYRIEPGHIESVMGQFPGCREAAVVRRPDANGQPRLAAYVVPNPDAALSFRALRDFLKRRLPDYMIPSSIVALAALPRTPSGKVDRGALQSQPEAAAPSAEEQPDDRSIVNAEGAEAILSDIWAEILCLDRVSVDDNFFDLGGNSILSIQMISRANQAGLRLTPRLLWRHQTISELARVASDPSSSTAERPDPDKPRPAPRAEPSAKLLVTVESLRSYGREALERAGLLPAGAAIVTEVQLEASLRDQPTHNMVSIPRYARRIASGTINPRPDIRIERRSDTSAHIDGDNGPGQWIAVVAMETAIGIAREKGIGVVGVRRSNHLGAAGHYPWLATRAGLIGLCTTNGPVILAPTGGLTPTFGNNPLGVGIPAGVHHPLLLDIAMSVAPRGRIGLQLAEGKPLPAGWILDRNGRPSTDPADLVAGLGVPIGGHKGYGLTLIMEVLAGVLTGAAFGWDNRRADGPRAEKPANFGHFFLAIDPELFMPALEFTTRVDRLIAQTKAGERAEGVEEILVPGESELRAREQSLRDGVPLRLSTYNALRKYGSAAGLDTELVVIR